MLQPPRPGMLARAPSARPDAWKGGGAASRRSVGGGRGGAGEGRGANGGGPGAEAGCRTAGEERSRSRG